jgi:hypothetical protein
MDKRLSFINELINSQTNLTDTTKKDYIAKISKLIEVILETDSSLILKSKYDKKIFKMSKLNDIVEIIDDKWENNNTSYNYIFAMYKYLSLVVGVNNKHLVKLNNNIITVRRTININTPKQLTEQERTVNYSEGKQEFINFIEEEKYDIEEEYYPLALLLLFDSVRRNDILDSYISKDIKDIDTTKNWIYKDNNKWYYLANKYKTVKKYGKLLFDINNNHLISLLEEIVKSKNKKKILDTHKNTWINWLKETTDEFFDTQLTIQGLRRLDATNDVFNLSLSEKELLEKARKAGHSLSTRLSQYARR